jgi:hypothetical protein
MEDLPARGLQCADNSSVLRKTTPWQLRMFTNALQHPPKNIICPVPDVCTIKGGTADRMSLRPGMAARNQQGLRDPKQPTRSPPLSHENC